MVKDEAHIARRDRPNRTKVDGEPRGCEAVEVAKRNSEKSSEPGLNVGVAETNRIERPRLLLLTTSTPKIWFDRALFSHF